jgi:hypothetical protein
MQRSTAAPELAENVTGPTNWTWNESPPYSERAAQEPGTAHLRGAHRALRNVAAVPCIDGYGAERACRKTSACARRAFAQTAPAMPTVSPASWIREVDALVLAAHVRITPVRPAQRSRVVTDARTETVGHGLEEVLRLGDVAVGRAEAEPTAAAVPVEQRCVLRARRVRMVSQRLSKCAAHLAPAW